MPWRALPVGATGDLLTVTEMNDLLGNLRLTMPGLANAAGEIAYATGLRTVTMLSLGVSSSILRGGSGQMPHWTTPLTGVQRVADSGSDNAVPTWGSIRRTFLAKT